MSLLKTVTQSDAARAAICWVAARYVRFVYATGRWTVVRGDIPQAFWDAGRPFILGFWHGRILMMPCCWPRGLPINNLVSPHRDGQVLAGTLRHFGFTVIPGSTRRGGTAALRAMLKALKSGECVAISPDGPRGPRMRASDGIVQVARLSGVPVIPCAAAPRRRSILGSWDSFLVAWPFAGGVHVWGEPIEVPRDADETQLEAARQRIEAAITAVADEADALVGQPPVEPAPAAPPPEETGEDPRTEVEAEAGGPAP